MADKKRWIEVLEDVKAEYPKQTKALDRVPNALDVLFKNRSYVPAKGETARDGVTTEYGATVQACFTILIGKAKTAAEREALTAVYERGFEHYRTIHAAQRADTIAASRALAKERAAARKATEQTKAKTKTTTKQTKTTKTTKTTEKQTKPKQTAKAPAASAKAKTAASAKANTTAKTNKPTAKATTASAKTATSATKEASKA